MNPAPVLIVMGVSGCGKTTLGKELATRLVVPFFDADDFHPAENVAKMRAGIPLNDDDRLPWLQSLADGIRQWSANGGAVLACSALKESYRGILRSGGPVVFIHIDGSRELLLERISARQGHYMPASLLDSQLATLESPSGPDAIVVDLALNTEAQADAALGELDQLFSPAPASHP